jgi:hypothetical protein
MLPSKSSHIKAVYDPRAFILHAALLHQAFAHCGKFPTAASRRSLGRVSVPVWLVILSDQLKIVALVSHYLTNKLILRRPFPNRRSFTPWSTCGISYSFEQLSLSLGYVPTRYSAVRHSSTLTPHSRISKVQSESLSVRLACIRHAASVHPEPGSNSPKKNLFYRHQFKTDLLN